MYLGIDFLVTAGLDPYVIEVNVGLPGGAQEYDLTHRVYLGKPSDIFARVEKKSLEDHGKSFKDYLHSLSFIESLKPFKIWMDGKGPLPDAIHPGLRLEDKWVQYQLLKPIAPMPETILFDPSDLADAERFLERKGKVVLKRRLGRGGKGFQIVTQSKTFHDMRLRPHSFLIQEYIERKVEGYVFSVRAIAFGGEFMCSYANLSDRTFSNHGLLAFVSEGEPFGLSDKPFQTQLFNQKSWEAEVWFGKDIPAYLRHNLYEDEVARTTLRLPRPLLGKMKELAVNIERLYEGLDLWRLPEACFEKKGRGV